MPLDKTIIITASVTAAAASSLVLWFYWKRHNSDPILPPLPSLNAQGREIYLHLQTTQNPAPLLGIRVDDFSGSTLTLSAPLHPHNTNVHGTAFAGSLYSVAVLCSYYLARQWLLLQQPNLAHYTLVAKTGTIQYRRPVREGRIVAHSVLPSPSRLDQFREELHNNHKAYLTVDGHINLPHGQMACEYSMQLCAYRPSG